MNINISVPNSLKTALYKGDIDFTGAGVDTFKTLLMRPGFQYNAERHVGLINIKTTTATLAPTGVDYLFDTSARSLIRTSGSWADDGFVIGNKITTTGTSTGPYIISNIADYAAPGDGRVMRVSLVAGESTYPANDESETLQTVTSDDEMPTGNGYTQGDVDAVFNLDDPTAVLTLDSHDWTAFGTVLETSPGALVIDYSHADSLVVAYLSFSPWRMPL